MTTLLIIHSEPDVVLFLIEIVLLVVALKILIYSLTYFWGREPVVYIQQKPDEQACLRRGRDSNSW